MASKYKPLEVFLLDLPVNQSAIKLSFGEIETILKSKLPASAYEDNRWWEHETEGNHVNKRAWATAGWMVSKVDVKRKQVSFVRKI